MKVLFGSEIVDGRGKVGGHVLSKNRGGAYKRTKVSPSNPKTAYQIAVRSNFSAGSRGWLALTDAQRLAWNTAKTLQQRSNVFGNSVLLSGKALYQAVSNNLRNIGVAPISSPVNPAASFAFSSVSAVADNSDQSLVLTFASAIPATHKVIVNATPSMSAGITNAANSMRQVTVLSSADVSPKTITVAYLARLGAIGSVGQKIHFSFIAVEIASGVASYAGSCVAVIQA